MGKLIREGWSRMDRLVDEMGEEGALRMICTRIAEGESPVEISRSQGMPWMVMRKWMEDSSDRMKDWELAKRCFADGLAYESLREMRDSGLEEVPLVRMRSEGYVKMAAKLSRVEWGEQKQSVVIEGLSMDAALGGFAGALLEKIRSVQVSGNMETDRVVSVQEKAS